MNWKLDTSKLATALGALLCLGLAGCFDTKEEFTVNPDGSGKVVHECSFPQMVTLTGGSEPNEESMKEALRKVLEGSKGVDAWRDVSYKRLDDGRLLFRGTAYFKSLSNLQILNQSAMAFEWRKEGNGKVILSLSTNQHSADEGLGVKPAPAALTDLPPEQQAARLKAERAKLLQMKPLLTSFFSTMKQQVTLHLPGNIVENSNFEPGPAGALALKFDGAKLLEVLDKLAADDQWVKSQLARSPSNLMLTDPLAFDDSVNGMILGKSGPTRAVITSANTPLFDYASELAAAQKDFAKVQKQLGLSARAVAAPAQGQPLKSLKVVGVRLVTQADKKQNWRPFNYDAGYTLALVAELPGSVLAVTDESAIATAIADDGASLLPTSGWKRRLHFPRLSPDRTSVLFEAELGLPAAGVKGLKELSGHLHYSVASGTREIDLGFDELKPGASGTELGAEIRAIEGGWSKDGSQQMQLKLNVREENLRSVCVVVDGARTALERRGYSGGGDSYTFTLESKRAFPAKGRLVAEIFDKVQTFEAPFKLENITLLGEPAATGR
jgi:hypothetical protein